ncbi:ATP-binding protein [Kitasatospora viridis]|uniref:Regulatory LuxR family protein n=1 Tax=Kitasatospora viridis TaxID=281105 RepID=A0A561TSK0_9ACTN|nr:AAA family ATPase [Kitasatospora viridis]TWF90078.1 regulatory LuxR family protein [Kitasatospora viridis]
MQGVRGLTPGGPLRFVGRQRELDLLLSAVRHPPAVVLVEGEAGIGKSRLIAEATTALTREHRPVLVGFCHPLREPFPYGPVVDALGKAGPCLPTGLLPPATGALAPLLPDLADRFPPPPPPTDDPRAERLRVIQGVRSLLAAMGEAVLVVEDLHWVDAATRELLLLLARDLPPQLSVVLSYRTDAAGPRTPVLGSAFRRPPGIGGAVIPLSRLGESDLHDLATDSLGFHATPALAAALFARSEGLPLVAEEDLLTLAEHSRTHGFEGIAGRLRDADVPRGLREALTERLAALSPEGVAVTSAVAVLAVPASQELLTGVAGLTEDQAERGLVEALDASVLREDGGGRYAFRHVLAQQVAYGYVRGPRRIHLHERALEELRQQPAPPLVQIAHHTRALGDRAAWLKAAEEAVDHATAVGDTGTAETLIGQILDEPDLDPAVRSRAALALAGLAARGVDPAAHARRLRRILADPQLSKAARGEIRFGLGLVIFNELADTAGAEELEKAVEELGENPSRAARAMSTLTLNEGQGQEMARAWQERAERAVEDGRDEAVRALVHGNRLALLMRSGDPFDWSLLDPLPRRADDPDIVRQSARTLHNVADVAFELGHDRRAARLMAEARELARQVGYPLAECYIAVALLRMELLAGRWDTLEGRFADIVAAYPAMTLPRIEQALCLGRLTAADGRRAQALEHFTTAAEEVQQRAVSAALRAAAGLTAIHLAQGNPGLAQAVARKALDLLRQAGAWPKATGLVPVAVEAELACEAREAAEQLVEDAAGALAGRDTPAATAELHLARGLLAMAAQPPRAADHFATAQQLWQDIGRPYETALAAEHRARALAETETDPAEAAEPVAQATAAFTSLGATADLARADHLSRSLGLTKPGSGGQRGYGDRLSPRERQVAELLARNATNQEIADALFLSPRTVEQHVANALRKLDTTRKNVAAKLTEDEAAAGR